MLPIASSPQCRVVVVEDDVVTRRLLCNAIDLEPTLTLSGAFGTVVDALEGLEREPVELLLTDLGLPDGSGLSIIHHCRRIWPEADIMVITMSSDESQVLACIEAGASGYVLKEAGHVDIVRALLDLKAGGSPISPVVARKVLARMRTTRRSDDDGTLNEMSGLTRRESAILELISRGGSFAKVAAALSLSVSTVQTHVKRIYGKLSVHSRSEAVFEAHRRGLLRFESAADVKPADSEPSASAQTGAVER
jgi:DNA-binding NarL/FixJ family response regulator